MKPTPLILIDDNKLYSDVLSSSFVRYDKFLVLHNDNFNKKTLVTFKKEKPELCLINYLLRQTDAIDVIQTIKINFPNVKIILYNFSTGRHSLQYILNLKINGILSLSSGFDEAVSAMAIVMDEKIFVSKSFEQKNTLAIVPLNNHYKQTNLTDIEIKILKLKWDGKKVDDISKEVCKGKDDISYHFKKMKEKINATSWEDLYRYGLNNNILSASNQ